MQDELALQVLALGKPTAVLLLHGGALGIDRLAAWPLEPGQKGASIAPRRRSSLLFADEAAAAGDSGPGGNLAILSGFYPGVYGASALAGAVFGAFSPSGRLPYTMLGAAYVDEVDFLSMDLPAQGMTYKVTAIARILVLN